MGRCGGMGRGVLNSGGRVCKGGERKRGEGNTGICWSNCYIDSSISR